MQLAGRVSEKVELITGGESGIGRATALLFAHEGAAIALADVNADAGRRVADEITQSGGRVFFDTVDVTRAADCQRLVERAIREFGRIDSLFNNAGITRRATGVDLSEGGQAPRVVVDVDGGFLISRRGNPHNPQTG